MVGTSGHHPRERNTNADIQNRGGGPDRGFPRGCDKKPPPAAEVRPVRVVTVKRGAEGETVSLTGQVRAKDQVSLAFRLEGRMIKRLVNVGDVLKGGEIVAQLDPQNQQNTLRTAQANLASDEAALTQARLTFGRQQQLLVGGWTPRAKFDEAQQMLLGAEAQVDAAHAQVGIAQDQLSYTVLFADAPGVVTATGRRAGRGGPRRTDDRERRASGRARCGVRCVRTAHPHGSARSRGADRADQRPVRASDRPRAGGFATGGSRHKNVPGQGRHHRSTPAMELGSTVTGSIKLSAPSGLLVPPSALSEADGRPAVWVVDPNSQTVSLRNVDVSRYDPAEVVVSQGLDAGEIVVTAGVQTLHPGQKVRLLGGTL